MAGGRPTKYDPKYCELARRAMLLGKTLEDFASVLEVSVSTLHNWKNEHPEFLDAIKSGGVSADGDIANSLYAKALGYYKDGKYVPGDTAACIFWLKNRQPKLWRDKREYELPSNPYKDSTDSELEAEVARLIANKKETDEGGE